MVITYSNIGKWGREQETKHYIAEPRRTNIQRVNVLFHKNNF